MFLTILGVARMKGQLLFRGTGPWVVRNMFQILEFYDVPLLCPQLKKNKAFKVFYGVYIYIFLDSSFLFHLQISDLALYSSDSVVA